MANLDFGNTVFDGQLQPMVPIQNPVEDDSAIIAAEGRQAAAEQMSKGFDVIGRGLESATNFFKSALTKQADEQKTGVLAGLQSDIMLIADAVDQGRMKVPEARSRLRALNAQYVADNPGIIDDINTLQAKLTSNAGLAQISVTGNEDYQRQQKLVDDAVNGGWQAPGMSEDTAVSNMLNAKRDVESLAAFKRSIEYKQATRQEITEEDKWKATQTLKSFVNNSYPWVVSQVEQARALIDNGGDAGVIIQQLKDNIGQQTAQIGFLRTVGGDVNTDYMLAGVDKLISNFEDYATGKTTTEVYNARSAAIEAQNKATLMADPKLGPLISASNLIGNSNPQLIVGMSTEVSRIFGQNATLSVDDKGNIKTDAGKPADVLGDSAEIRQYFNILTDGMTKSATSPTPEVNKEVATQLTNLLRGVDAYSMSVNDARDFKSIIEFFANPTVGKFAEANKAVIPKGVQDKASAIIQAQYENVLLPLVEKIWNQTVVASYPNDRGSPSGSAMSPLYSLPLKDLVDPVWDGTGITFKPKPEFTNNAIVTDTVNRLNSGNDSVANPLNTLIRAKAHMSGSTDYKSVYETSLQERLFGNGDATATDTTQKAVSDIDQLAGGFQTEAQASSDRDQYYAAIKHQESGGSVNADNPNSSASGLYQFLDGTWKTIVNSKEGKDAGLTLEGKNDPLQQEKAIRIFTDWNSTTLLNNGLQPSNGNLYAMHFLGNAVPVLTSPDDTPLADVLPPKTMKANPFLVGHDVAWFKSWINKVGSKKVNG